MKRLLIGALFALALNASFANAQSTQQICYTSNGSNCVPSIQASNSVPLAISSATTTQIVPLSGTKSIYVTSWDGISSAAGTLLWVYGTGTNCATGTTSLTGTYTFGASTVFSKGDGHGGILFVPPGNALCVTSASTINFQGSISYAQF